MSFSTKIVLALVILFLAALSELVLTKRPASALGPASCLVTTDKQYVICVQPNEGE